MENRYTAVFEEVGNWWTGYVEEIPGCNVQERTLEEARKSLKEVIRLILEANRELARQESEGHQVIREEGAVRLNEAKQPRQAPRDARAPASSGGRSALDLLEPGPTRRRVPCRRMGDVPPMANAPART